MSSVCVGHLIFRGEGKEQTGLFTMATAEDGSWPPVLGSRQCQGSCAVLTVEKITDNSYGKKEKVVLENQGYEAPNKKYM